MSPRHHDALIVFAKVPRPGEVKTRLTPVLTEEQAARLYEAFLRDALEAYVGMEVHVRLYLTEPSDVLPSGTVPDGVTVHRQRGDGLGARMRHAFLETFAAGLERAVVIGTDHPTLPLDFVHQAFAVLDAPLSVSLGPSDDGGYYLLGMNDFFPQLFDGMTYSHAAVFEQTLRRATEAGARVTVLPHWYDVDMSAALDRLVTDLQEDPDAAPRTRHVLAQIGRMES